MKIAFVTVNYPSGGAEKQCFRFAKHIKKLGHEVEILAFQNENSFEQENVLIRALDRHIAYTEKTYFLRQVHRIGEYSTLGKYVDSKDYDIIIVFNPLFLPLSMFTKKTLVFFSRTYDNWALRFPFLGMLRRYNAIATNNYPNYLIFREKRLQCKYIPNIVFDEPQELLKVDNFVKNKRYLLVSNISARKNIPIVLKAFGLLSDHGFKLAIAGKCQGSYGTKIVHETKQYENVEYLGYLSEADLSKQYLKSEGVVHASRMEGTPNSILDAIKHGKPVIASNIPEHVYLLENCQDFLFEVENVDDLAGKIIKLHEKISLREENIVDIMDYFQRKLRNFYSPHNADDFVEFLSKL